MVIIMFDDLIALFSGWYSDFVDSISSLHFVEVVLDGSDNVISSTSSSPDVWSAYVPWEQLIATVVLVTLVVCVFKFMRTVLCKIL